MSRKAAGKQHTSRVQEKQKNGDIYVYERVTAYDPKKGYTRILSKKLLGRIPAGSTQMTATRHKSPSAKKPSSSPASPLKGEENVPKQEDPLKPTLKRKEQGKNADTSPALKAVRQPVGMMEIIEYIGRVSGIDAAVYEACPDKDTALKIISLARYLFASDGGPLSGIATWQLTHLLPYEEDLSEDICRDLFQYIGQEESIPWKFFLSRANTLESPECFALDTAVLPASYEKIPDAGFRFGRVKDEFMTVRILTMYSAQTGQPIAYAKLSGAASDAGTVENALERLALLGLEPVEVSFGPDVYSEQNLAALLQKDIHFLMPVKPSVTWVKPMIDRHRDDLGDITAMCKFDPSIHAVTEHIRRTFDYAYVEDGQKAVRHIPADVYLHIFLNSESYAKQAHFELDLYRIKRTLEEEKLLTGISSADQKKALRYLVIWQDSDGVITKVDFNRAACREGRDYRGIFVLISDNESDPFRSLRIYLGRGKAEDYLWTGKEYAGEKKPAVWSEDTLRGRLFVQFVSLCYREYYAAAVDAVRKSLSKKTKDAKEDNKTVSDAEEKLLTWLNEFDLHQQLAWFDAVRTAELSAKAAGRRWSAETAMRDRLFLAELGMLSEDDVTP